MYAEMLLTAGIFSYILHKFDAECIALLSLFIGLLETMKLTMLSITQQSDYFGVMQRHRDARSLITRLCVLLRATQVEHAVT